MIINTYNDLKSFKKRRDRLNTLCGKDSVIVLFSGEEGHLAPFRPQSSFLYLTGFEEPGSCLVIRTGKVPELHLFVRDRNPAMELWDGERYGVERAQKVFSADKAYDIEHLVKELPELLRGQNRLYFSMGLDSELDKLILSARKKAQALDRRSGQSLMPIHDPSEILSQLRVIKDSDEQKWMKETCELSARAHEFTMKSVSPGMTEKQIQGILVSSFFKDNAQGEAYPSIVASGPNATTLHYRANNRKTKKGDFLLIDAAAEKYFYKADITRTYPIDGKFSQTQKDLYQAVLEVQKSLISKVVVGFSLPELQELTILKLTEVMVELGLLKGKTKELIEKKSYQKYYAHGVGHYLGLDVHDIGFSKLKDKPVPFQAGMVITVEPGIYIPESDSDVDKELRGLGVRIEDDILITKSKPDIMTISAPKEIKDLEKIIGSKA